MADPGKELFRRDLSDAEMAELEERVERSQAEALALAEEAEAAYRATGLPEPQWRPKPKRSPLRRGFLALAGAGLAMALVLVWLPPSPVSQPGLSGELRGPGTLSRGYRVAYKGKAALELRPGPGFLRSTAALEPGQKPATHPFVDARALDPMQEDALRKLLLASKDYEDFVRRLKAAGYELTPLAAGR